ncbi:MAG: YhcH/YjgK/YiaL family protein [Pirellulaceae bacterium]
MIVARLEDAGRYAALHPLFARGFEFLQRDDLRDLPDGRHEIDSERVFAIIARGIGRGQADSPLEYHRRYIDIQYVISGVDSMGWLPASECRRHQFDYDGEKDLGFFADRPPTWVRVPSGCFTVFYPEDAHAPLGGSGPLHKVVVKVSVDPGD